MSADPMITEMNNIAMPMLTIMPVCLMTATMADASPVSLGSTEPMMMDVLGAENIENPIPMMICVTTTVDSGVPTP